MRATTLALKTLSRSSEHRTESGLDAYHLRRDKLIRNTIYVVQNYLINVEYITAKKQCKRVQYHDEKGADCNYINTTT